MDFFFSNNHFWFSILADESRCLVQELRQLQWCVKAGEYSFSSSKFLQHDEDTIHDGCLTDTAGSRETLLMCSNSPEQTISVVVLFSHYLLWMFSLVPMVSIPISQLDKMIYPGSAASVNWPGPNSSTFALWTRNVDLCLSSAFSSLGLLPKLTE